MSKDANNQRSVSKCSLPAPEFEARRAQLLQQLRPALSQATLADQALTLQFATGSIERSTLERLVALERRCCGFLQFEITTSALNLKITAPEGSEPVLELMHKSLIIET